MRRSRSIAVLTAIAASAVLLIPAGATAAATKTRVTIGPNQAESKLVGAVRSQKPRCERNRMVTLYYESTAGTGFRPVAGDESNERGRWSIRAPEDRIPPGRYYVKVRKDGDCARARSETIRYRGPIM